ncbi:hypothetical protein AOLI_G00098230 [Acnodon oligacanthus]
MSPHLATTQASCPSSKDIWAGCGPDLGDSKRPFFLLPIPVLRRLGACFLSPPLTAHKDVAETLPAGEDDAEAPALLPAQSSLICRPPWCVTGHA